MHCALYVFYEANKDDCEHAEFVSITAFYEFYAQSDTVI